MKKQVLLFLLLLFPLVGHAVKQVIDGIQYDLDWNNHTAKVVWYQQYEGDITIPPTVEYSLTDRGRSLIPALESVYRWAEEQMTAKK